MSRTNLGVLTAQNNAVSYGLSDTNEILEAYPCQTKLRQTSLCLPGWAKYVKSAVLHVFSLAHYTIVAARGWAGKQAAARPTRLVKNALRNAKTIRKMPIPKPPCSVTRLESYHEGLLSARNVSPFESRGTEYSAGTGRAWTGRKTC